MKRKFYLAIGKTIVSSFFQLDTILSLFVLGGEYLCYHFIGNPLVFLPGLLIGTWFWYVNTHADFHSEWKRTGNSFGTCAYALYFVVNGTGTIFLIIGSGIASYLGEFVAFHTSFMFLFSRTIVLLAVLHIVVCIYSAYSSVQHQIYVWNFHKGRFFWKSEK